MKKLSFFSLFIFSLALFGCDSDKTVVIYSISKTASSNSKTTMDAEGEALYAKYNEKLNAISAEYYGDSYFEDVTDNMIKGYDERMTGKFNAAVYAIEQLHAEFMQEKQNVVITKGDMLIIETISLKRTTADNKEDVVLKTSDAYTFELSSK